MAALPRRTQDDQMTAQIHQLPIDADRLATIAGEIRKELTAAGRSALESAIMIGERLIEAKKIAGHGGFTPWLKENFHAGKPQASRYMNAARNAEALRAKVASEATFHLNTIPALLALPDAPEDDGDFRPAKAVGPKRAATREPTERERRADAAYDQLQAAGEDVTRQGLSDAAGVSNTIADKVLAVRRATDAQARPLPELSMSAQQKLEAWQRKLEADFDYRVRLESHKWLTEARIPNYEKQIADLKRMLEYPRYAVMFKEEYNIILKCLHPDGGNNRTPEQLSEAFRIFTKYKAKMASDAEVRANVLKTLPTREEMLARKKMRTR